MRAIFVILLGFLIQITGINAIIYYSPRIFEAMGFTGNFALTTMTFGTNANSEIGSKSRSGS